MFKVKLVNVEMVIWKDTGYVEMVIWKDTGYVTVHYVVIVNLY